VLQDGKRACARRDLCIGAQHRKIGLPAIELRERLGAVGVGHDLETQPRRTVLEQRGKLGGKTGVKAVGVSDGEDQRFGIPHPGATAPNRRDSEDQCQRSKQQHLSAVLLTTRLRGGRFGIGVGELSAHRS
jgi:hypothetical protein